MVLEGACVQVGLGNESIGSRIGLAGLSTERALRGVILPEPSQILHEWAFCRPMRVMQIISTTATYPSNFIVSQRFRDSRMSHGTPSVFAIFAFIELESS